MKKRWPHYTKKAWPKVEEGDCGKQIASRWSREVRDRQRVKKIRRERVRVRSRNITLIISSCFLLLLLLKELLVI